MRVVWIGLLSAWLASSASGLSASLRAIDKPATAHPALSIGAPNDGRLEGATRLPAKPYLRVVPYYAESHARWGVPSLIGLIDRAAQRVADQYPGAVLAVGDLSREHGGELNRHRSHESGRDADVGYYLQDKGKKQVLLERFVPIGVDGTAQGRAGVSFDDARNWALIHALLEDKTGQVSQIFVAPHIRARLLRFAERAGVSLALRQQVAQRLLQPRGAPLHDDHFHVRVACPPNAEQLCIESAVLATSHVRPRVPRVRQRAGSPAQSPASSDHPAVRVGPQGAPVLSVRAVLDPPLAPETTTSQRSAP